MHLAVGEVDELRNGAGKGPARPRGSAPLRRRPCSWPIANDPCGPRRMARAPSGRTSTSSGRTVDLFPAKGETERDRRLVPR